MDSRRQFFIGLMLMMFLVVAPCRGDDPLPAGALPDLPQAAVADITVAPIAYQGPILSDIGMKLITYEGPELADITVAPIQYTDKTVAISQKPPLGQTVSKSARPTPFALAPQLIPGVQPGLKILSPKPGQTFTGSVPLEVEITGWQGIPRVDLDWWWNAPSPAGQWPATPQGMTVVDHLDGTTRIMIPRSAFPETGQWRVKASVRMSDHQQVIDDVSFTLSGMLKPTGNTGAMKLTPKQTTPSAVPANPAATQKVQPLPATPRGKTIRPAN
jgi:hypothetical protein